MPTYQYACTACGHRFEAVQSFSDASLTDCPECAGRLRKVFSSVGIVFKGSGFYRTDSRAGSVDAAGSGKGEKVSADSSALERVRRRRRAPRPPTRRTKKADSGLDVLVVLVRVVVDQQRPRRSRVGLTLPTAGAELSTSASVVHRFAVRPPVELPVALASSPTTRGRPMGREPPHRMRRSARLLATLRTPGWRRTLLVRRTAALLLAALALALALRPADAATRGPVVVAARDLASGTALTAPTSPSPPGQAISSRPVCCAAPADGDGPGARRSGPGRRTDHRRPAGRAGRGRAVTGRPGDAAVPVRLADPDVARLLEPGSRVDVVTPAPDGDRPVVLAADAAVLTVVAAEADTLTGQGSRGRLVLVALPRADAARVAAAALSEQVAVTLR